MRIRAFALVLAILVLRAEPAPPAPAAVFLATTPTRPADPWGRRGTFAWDDQEGGFFLAATPGGPWRLDLLDGGGRPLARLRVDGEEADLWVPATGLIVRAPTAGVPWRVLGGAGALAALPGWIEQGGVGLGTLKEASDLADGWSELRCWPEADPNARLRIERDRDGSVRKVELDLPSVPPLTVLRAEQSAVVQVGALAPAVLRWSSAVGVEASAARPPAPSEAVEITVGELWRSTIGAWVARRAVAIDRRLEAEAVSGEGGAGRADGPGERRSGGE